MEKAVKKDKAALLGSEKIPKLILSFALTTFAALAFNSLYNLTDALFVSWGVGDNAMGSVSIVFPFTVIQSAVATAVGGGAASIVSRKLGEGKPEEAAKATLSAMAVFYVTAVLVTLLGFILMNPLLGIMGVTDDLAVDAKNYFIIILAGTVFSTGFSSIIRAEGKMLYALLIWVIPISLNVALDALFVLALKWGVQGSAAATVICQFTSFCMSILFFTRFSIQKFSGVRPSFNCTKEVVSIGLPSLVQTGGLSLVLMIINSVLSGTAGTLGVNSFAYVKNFLTYLLLPMTALSQAVSPVVGYNYGIKNTKRISGAVKFTLIVGMVYAAIITLITFFAGKYFTRMFTRDEEILEFAASALRILAISFLFQPLPIVLGATLQSIGKKLLPLLLFAAKPVFLVAGIYIAAHFMGTNGIWLTYVLAEVAAAVFAAVVIFVSVKKRKASADADK